MRITMRIVDTIRPGEITWDSLVRGFGLRCQRNRKVYILKATISGRPRWFSIGKHGAPWTPDTAREQAQILWGKIRAGEDLAAMREARRRRATVADLCARYLEDHAREHKKPSTAHLDERNIANHIRPLLGELCVDDISRADIDRFKRAIKDGKTRKPGASNRTSFRGGSVVAGGAVVANRCLTLLSKMFNLARCGAGGGAFQPGPAHRKVQGIAPGTLSFRRRIRAAGRCAGRSSRAGHRKPVRSGSHSPADFYRRPVGRNRDAALGACGP